VNVRPLLSSELDALLALHAHLHERDLPLPERTEVEEVWNEAFANPRIRYFGGFENDDLISSCAIALIPNLTRGCRPYGVIENVVTHASHRNKGWGRRVLGAALEFAWANRCYKVLLFTGSRQESTLKFYEGAGFDRNGKTGFVAKPN
jgi:GNAT superfamily N-acetyltransferase